MKESSYIMGNSVSITLAILAYALFKHFFLKTEEEKDKADTIMFILSPFLLAIAVYIDYKY